jgi:autotransporter-associated beta strand protein
MKPKFLAFPLAIILASSANAGQFVWTGGSNSTWANPANWDITASPPVSPDTYPVPGSTYASDFLNIRNNGDLTIDPPGTTPGADAVYDAGVTTTFNGGRCFVIGTGNGPTATPANTKGYAKLSVLSGTIVGARSSNSGSEPYMANRADSTLLIDGGNVDLSAQLNNFRLIQEGFPDITSTITIDSGSLSCRSLDLVFDQENDPSTVFGNGIVNLNGGTFTMLRFVRTAASDPGQTSFTLNLNGGTLRPAGSLTAPSIFLDALTDLTTVVKAGGAIINTTNPATPTTAISMTIAEVLEHDDTLGATLDGGLTKNGIGNLVLSGANTFTGPVTVNAGTSTTPSRLLLASDSAAGTGEITLADSYADIQVNNTRNIANAITIANTGAEKTLLLPSPGGGNFAAATFSGPITINDTDIDHFRVRSDTNCFLTLSGKVSGLGGIYKFQSGTVTLSNSANDFTGGAKITQGGLSFANGALGSSGSVTMDGGTLTWSAGNPQDISSRLVMVDGKTATLNLAERTTPDYAISNVTFANAIGNNSTAALVKTGNGSLDLTQPSTYSGSTTVTQGTLNFAPGALGTTSNVTMNGGTLRWIPAAGNSEDVSTRIVMVNAKTAIFSTGANNVTLATAIGNATTGNLKKTGSGILALNGDNSYTGTTTVDGGTLQVNGSLDGASAVTVTTGDLGGSGTINGSVTVAAAGNISPGSSAGTLTIGNGLDLTAMAAGTGKLKFELGSDTASSDQIAVTFGTLALGAGELGIEDLAISNLGGLQAGTYTLINSAGGVSGTVNGTVAEILTGFNGQLQASPNSLDLVVTAAPANPYLIWSGGAAFELDSNNDGVDNGLAWFLGAPDKEVNANGLLPKTTQTAGALVLEFDCLNAAARGPATFAVQYSSDLGQADPWAETAVPGAAGSFTDGVVDFLVTDPEPVGEGLLKVVATIPAGEAAGGKLFGRVSAQP